MTIALRLNSPVRHFLCSFVQETLYVLLHPLQSSSIFSTVFPQGLTDTSLELVPFLSEQSHLGDSKHSSDNRHHTY